MEITITGRHFEVTEAIRSYAKEKLSKLEKFYDGITSIEAILKNEDRKFHCEIIVHIANKPDAVIDVADDNMYAAIDVAHDKAQRQVRKTKTKLRDHRPAKEGAVAVEAAAGDEDEE